MKKENLFNKFGFTLIELLVVVAIIGVLSSMIMSSMGKARAKARDSQRIASLKQLQNAIEMYYTDFQHYPIYDGGTGEYGYLYSDYGSHCGGGTGGNWCNLETTLASYIPQLPRDPNGETQMARWFTYRSHGNGASYGIQTMLEGPAGVSVNDGGCYPNNFEIGPSVKKCGCAGLPWYRQGTSNCY